MAFLEIFWRHPGRIMIFIESATLLIRQEARHASSRGNWGQGLFFLKSFVGDLRMQILTSFLELAYLHKHASQSLLCPNLNNYPNSLTPIRIGLKGESALVWSHPLIEPVQFCAQCFRKRTVGCAQTPFHANSLGPRHNSRRLVTHYAPSACSIVP